MKALKVLTIGAFASLVLSTSVYADAQLGTRVTETGGTSLYQTPIFGYQVTNGVEGKKNVILTNPDGSKTTGYINIEWPKTYDTTPRVTALHSVNAALANSGEDSDAVYWLPKLEDLPTDMKGLVAGSTITAGLNKDFHFAAVYDGYFDQEVAYKLMPAGEAVTGKDKTSAKDAADVTRYQTSKKVFSTTKNSRALELMGYDLLLSNEHCALYTDKDGTFMAKYLPEFAQSSTSRQSIKTETAVMDLYKALGQYQYDLKIEFTKDPLLRPDSSPIGQYIPYQMSGQSYVGVDNSLGACWIWASRTNPDLYWDMCQKDMIFGGGAKNAKTVMSYAGETDAVTFVKNRKARLTIGEFCEIARAMMELYGEPVMTEQEQLVMMQAYGFTLPTALDTDQSNAVRYLAAKGILNPTDIDFTSYLKYDDMTELLIRIADPDSRLTFKESDYNTESLLFQNGYTSGTVEGISEVEDIQQVTDIAHSVYWDYYVESYDNLTNFSIVNTDKTGATNSVIADSLQLLTADRQESLALQTVRVAKNTTEEQTPTTRTNWSGSLFAFDFNGVLVDSGSNNFKSGVVDAFKYMVDNKIKFVIITSAEGDKFSERKSMFESQILPSIGNYEDLYMGFRSQSPSGKAALAKSMGVAVFFEDKTSTLSDIADVGIAAVEVGNKVQGNGIYHLTSFSSFSSVLDEIASSANTNGVWSTIDYVEYPVFVNEGITADGFYHFKILKDAFKETTAEPFRIKDSGALATTDVAAAADNDFGETLKKRALKNVNGMLYFTIGYRKNDVSISAGDDPEDEEETKEEDNITIGNTGFDFFMIQEGGGIYKVCEGADTLSALERSDEANSATLLKLNDIVTVTPGTKYYLDIVETVRNEITDTDYIEGSLQIKGKKKKESIHTSIDGSTVNGLKKYKLKFEKGTGKFALELNKNFWKQKAYKNAKVVEATFELPIKYQYTVGTAADPNSKKKPKNKKKKGETTVHFSIHLENPNVSTEKEDEQTEVGKRTDKSDLERSSNELFLKHYTLDGYEWPAATTTLETTKFNEDIRSHAGYLGGFVGDKPPDIDTVGLTFGETTLAYYDKLAKQKAALVSQNSISENNAPIDNDEEFADDIVKVAGDDGQDVDEKEYDEETVAYVNNMNLGTSDYGDIVDLSNALGLTVDATSVDKARFYMYARYVQYMNENNTALDANSQFYQQLSPEVVTSAIMFTISKNKFESGNFEGFEFGPQSLKDALTMLYSTSAQGRNVPTTVGPYGLTTNGGSTVNASLTLTEMRDDGACILVSGISSLDVFKKNFRAPNKVASNPVVAYYKNDGANDEILVAASTLTELRLISKPIMNGDVLELLGKDGSNIYLKSGGNNYIIVGDTMYPLESDQHAFIEANGQYYINLRALVGWGMSNLAIVDNNGTMQLVIPEYGTTNSKAGKRSNIRMKVYNTQNNYMLVRGAKVGGKKGIRLTNTYPLSNYLMVMDKDGDEDAIFYILPKATDGSNMYTTQTDVYDGDAAKLFTDMTGETLPEYDSAKYTLCAHRVNRSRTLNRVDNYNLAYVTQTVRSASGKAFKGLNGYVYVPYSINSLEEGYKATFGTNNKRTAIPIYNVKDAGKRYYNLNLNSFCTKEDNDGGKNYLAYGLLPSNMVMTAEDNIAVSNNKIAKLTIKNNSLKYEVQDAEIDGLETNGHMVPTYVGYFTKLRGSSSSQTSKVKSSKYASYYGTLTCKTTNAGIKIGDYRLTGTGVKCTLLRKSSNGTTVLGLPTLDSNLLSSAASAGESLSELLAAANELVDWDKYKFVRLVQQLDSITSIILIFILNIFPRIGMWCFMILLALTTLKGNRLAEMFAERVFDPVATLTFGKQTLQTIELKRTVIQSMLALSVFWIIQDGHLINFIVWCSQFFIVLSQR